jgi:RHS repeat-associated protein
VTDPAGRVTTFEYDLAGEVSKVTRPDGTSRQFMRDPLGRLTAQIDATGRTTQYVYDAADNLVQTVDPAGAVTQFLHDELHNLVAMTDANGHTRHWEYDAARRILATTLPSGATATMEYGAAGELTKYTNENGQAISYAYDDWGRPRQRTLPGGDVQSFDYTAGGRRAAVTTLLGTTSYAYDARGRLSAVTNADGLTIGYAYDAAGRLTARSVPSGVTAYAYDALGRMTSVVDQAGLVTQYQYNPAGRLTHTLLPNGAEEAREYDLLDRLTHIEHSSPAEGLVGLFDLSLDAAGHRTQVVENVPGAGRTVSYAHDLAHRLTQETTSLPGGGGSAVSYGYDAVGNRTSRTEGGATTLYAYDVDDRLIQAGPRTYGYDAAGNATSIVDPAGATLLGYNALHQLITLTTPDGTSASYDYDVEGIRTRRVVDGVLTSYLVDSNAAFPDVLEERVGGALAASYTYGISRLARHAGGVADYYHGDSTRSVRALTDATGAAGTFAEYDVFGRETGAAGDVGTFRFQGEQRDPETGLYYLRARYYDPDTGRFLSRDSLLVEPANPSTYHPYVFANNDPATFSDPSGHYSLGELAVGMTISATLSVAAQQIISATVPEEKVQYVVRHYLGTGYGEDALVYYIDVMTDHTRPAYQRYSAGFMSGFAVLWTPEVWSTTVSVIGGGATASGLKRARDWAEAGAEEVLGSVTEYSLQEIIDYYGLKEKLLPNLSEGEHFPYGNGDERPMTITPDNMPPDGKYCWGLDENGEVRVLKDDHHVHGRLWGTDASGNNKALVGAGTMIVEGGVIKHLDGDSGTYKPTSAALIKASGFMKEMGFQIKSVQLPNWDLDKTFKLDTKQVSPEAPALDWPGTSSDVEDALKSWRARRR